MRSSVPYFVVVSEQASSWVDSKPMREQLLWTEHAAWVNSLMYAGVVILGGPIGNGHPHRALLIVNSDSESALRTQWAEDPWVRAGILRTASVEPWKILVSNDLLDPVLAEITKPAASK
jgi:uncharacterized protein YciI